MKYKNLLVLGASGGCGRWVVRMANERGHQVTAIVRPESYFESSEGVNVVQGNILDEEFLAQALQNQDAVLSCVGIKRESPQTPWSPLVSPPDLTEQLAGIVVRAMNKQRVQRLIAISAAGVGDSWQNTNRLLRLLISKSNIGVAYRDLERMEQIYGESNLDWLVVRPVSLTADEPTGRSRIVDNFKLSSKIARGDVAGWMLDALERPEPFKNHCEMISWN